jgi:integrase
MTAARTLPVMELRPGLKDVRRPAELMHAYIVLSLLCGIRTEEARALRWAHVDLDGDPEARPPVPPHVAVWRSVRVDGETKTERSRRTLGLPAAAVQALRAWTGSQADERHTAGDDCTKFVSLMSHQGVSIEEIAGWSGTPPPGSLRSSTAANYGPSSPPASRSWTSS